MEMNYYNFKVQPVNGKPYLVPVVSTRADVARRAVSLDKEDTVTELKVSEFEKKFRLGTIKLKMKPREKVVFMRGISSFLENNSSRNPAESLPMIAISMTSPFSKGVCVAMEEMMAKEGIQTLSEAMGRFPGVFDPYDMNMIRTGDETGKLQEVLDILSLHTLKWIALKAKIKKAITYPIIMLVGTVVIGGFLLMKVVPDLLGGFSTMDIDMPTPVLIMEAVTGLLRSYWYVLVGAFLMTIISFISLRKRIFALEWVQRCMLKVPVFGNLISKTQLAQSLGALGMFIKSGKTDVDSLPVVIQLCDNIVFKEYYQIVLDNVKQGIDISTAFMRAKGKVGIQEGSKIAGQMNLAVSSGAISEMIEIMVNEREQEVDEYSDRLPELLNPLLIGIILAGGAGIVIPVFMALFAIVGGIQ